MSIKARQANKTASREEDTFLCIISPPLLLNLMRCQQQTD